MVWRAWAICQSVLSHMILAACLFGTTGISFCYLSLFTDCHKVCTFLEGAFQIKAGLFGVPLEFSIILAVALLVTNAVATLMILHKTWYCTDLLHVEADFDQHVSHTNESFPKTKKVYPG